MPQIDRFSVSLDTELLAAFDRHVAARGYENRSEAVRDMMRDLLVSTRLEQGTGPIAGMVTVVVDHRVGEAARRLRACLAADIDLICGLLHLPLDEHRDALAIGLRGPGARVRAVADTIQAMRGTAHGHLTTVPLQE